MVVSGCILRAAVATILSTILYSLKFIRRMAHFALETRFAVNDDVWYIELGVDDSIPAN
jgi:hypothetical protein